MKTQRAFKRKHNKKQMVHLWGNRLTFCVKLEIAHIYKRKRNLYYTDKIEYTYKY